MGTDVVCVKTQQSRELWHHSGIWQFAKSDGRLRSPASLESSPPLRRRLAPYICGASEIQSVAMGCGLPRWSLKPVEMRTSCQPQDACLILMIRSPAAQSTHASENTQLRYMVLDWNVACLLV